MDVPRNSNNTGLKEEVIVLYSDSDSDLDNSDSGSDSDVMLIEDSDDDSEIVLLESEPRRKKPRDDNLRVADNDLKRRAAPSVGTEIISLSGSASLKKRRVSVLSAGASTTNVVSTNLSVREAEVATLKAEFGDDDSGWGVKAELLDVDGRQLVSAISVSVIPLLNYNDLTDAFSLNAKTAAGDVVQISGLRHFPPIRVRVEYASLEENTVKFLVSCSWLLKEHVKKLNAELLSRFNQDGLSLTETLRWLERKSIKSLGIVHHRRVFYIALELEKNKSYQIVVADPNAVRAIFQDIRAKRQSFDDAAGSPLLYTKTFDCAVCFERRPAMAAVIFPGCRHFFCRVCIAQDMVLKINEGHLSDLMCLHHGCRTLADSEFVRTMVGFRTFRRYCDLRTDEFVSESSVIVRCPRKLCNVPMELHMDGPREVRCLTCGFHFCSSCKGRQHPDTPCLTDEQKREIRRTWKKADDQGRKNLQKKFGLDNVKFALEDGESEEWIAKKTKPCPKCKIPIQRISGCFSVLCMAKGCGTSFCWVCGGKLVKDHGAHEAPGGCKAGMNNLELGLKVNDEE